MNPVKGETGKYRLGIWVRDDLCRGRNTDLLQAGRQLWRTRTCGERRRHRRADEPVGRIYLRDENRQHPEGKNGVPGELAGIIDYGKSHCMGSITENSPLGIRGMLNDTAGELEGEVYEVAYKQDIALGKAYIISEVSGERAGMRSR